MANWYLLRDGQTLGPYPEETIREWIKTGQIGPEERLNREGDPNWLSLDMIPEFAGPAPAGPPPVPPPPPPPGTPFAAASFHSGDTSSTGVGSWISEAWRLMSANFGAAVLICVPILLSGAPLLIVILLWAMPVVSQLTRSGEDLNTVLQNLVAVENLAILASGSTLIALVLSWAVAFLLWPPLIFGITACFWDMIQTGTLTTAKLLSGIGRFFSMLAWGLFFCVISGVGAGIVGLVPAVGQLLSTLISFPIAAWMALSLYDMVARDVGIIEGISRGWSVLCKNWLNVSLMGLVAYVIINAGMLLCCVGALVALPLIQIAWGCAYRDLMAKR